MSKIVILGGTGFVGRSLVHRLQADGHRIDVLSRNREQSRHLLVYPQVEVHSTRVYHHDDLLRRLAGADVVVNLVGILNASGRSGRGFERAHVEFSQILIKACQQAGVPRLLQMSALHAGNPSSHYLRTRGEAEALVKGSGLDWTLFQPSVIFGPGDGLFCRFAGLLKLLPVLPLARANARFQPVYVRDVAEAMARSLVRGEAIGKTYVLGGPSICTLRELVEFTARVLGLRRWVMPLPDLLARLQGLAFDYMPVPLKAFSSDNFNSLRVDSVASRDGLAELGIRARDFEHIVPTYLGRDRQTQLDDFRSEAGR